MVATFVLPYSERNASVSGPVLKARRVFRKRILVADDQPGVRDALKLLLAIDHHQVTEARDGVEALDLVSSREFDLLITDYEMPRMKGNELAVKVKKLSPALPILMMTAYSVRVGDPTTLWTPF